MSFVAVLPQLIRGNGVPTVATRSTLIIYASLNVRILDHPRDSLAAMQVDIGHKASNRHAKTGFLFCSWQISKIPRCASTPKELNMLSENPPTQVMKARAKCVDSGARIDYPGYSRWEGFHCFYSLDDGRF